MNWGGVEPWGLNPPPPRQFGRQSSRPGIDALTANILVALRSFPVTHSPRYPCMRCTRMISSYTPRYRLHLLWAAIESINRDRRRLQKPLLPCAIKDDVELTKSVLLVTFNTLIRRQRRLYIRAMLNAIFVVERCLSVCLLRSGIVSKRLSSKFFHHLIAPTF